MLTCLGFIASRGLLLLFEVSRCLFSGLCDLCLGCSERESPFCIFKNKSSEIKKNILKLTIQIQTSTPVARLMNIFPKRLWYES
jgi:hypothetical protein